MSDPTVSVAETMRLEMRAKRVTDERDRLRKVIIALARQVKNRVIMDQFLGCVNPVTSVDGRLPFTPARVVTVEDKTMVLHNLIGHAILKWGRLARGESEETNPELVEVETIAAKGFKNFGAYPKDKNSVIHVLRTVEEERKIRVARRAAGEKALEMKARIRERGDGKDTEEGGLGEGVAGVEGGAPGSVPPPAAKPQ